MSTYQETVANLENNGFDNPSVGGMYKVFTDAIQLNVDAAATEIANGKQGIINLFLAQNYGKGGYYVNAAKAFQYGDNLLIDANGNYYYDTIDTTKQIISQAAFQWDKTQNYLSLKVGTTDSTGNVIALSAAQYTAFVGYMDNYLIAGVPVNIISKNPNIITYTANLSYYSTFDLLTLQTQLAQAIKNFQINFTYNGLFYINDFSDYIKANVAGVRDFFISNITCDGVAFSGDISLTSGTFQISASSTNTFIPVS
jgi:hypothetical protein